MMELVDERRDITSKIQLTLPYPPANTNIFELHHLVWFNINKILKMWGSLTKEHSTIAMHSVYFLVGKEQKVDRKMEYTYLLVKLNKSWLEKLVELRGLMVGVLHVTQALAHVGLVW